MLVAMFIQIVLHLNLHAFPLDMKTGKTRSQNESSLAPEITLNINYESWSVTYSVMYSVPTTFSYVV